MATLAIFAIVTNALFMQKGPHPAPIFATRPLLQRDAGPAPRLQAVQSTPVVDLANQARIQLIGNIQRELSRKGFYDGPADGIWGAKTDAAVRDFVQTTGLKINPEANDGVLRAIAAYNPKPANVPVAPAPA
ncbi:MAG: peptidoglycan-binding domain-containing protein, partial [Pseudolabrys sp.]